MLVKHIGVAATLEQTAEECIELAHVCLKLAREIRGDNPTFKDRESIVEHMHEEVADVLICIDELRPDEEKLNNWKRYKIKRMRQRFQEEE